VRDRIRRHRTRARSLEGRIDLLSDRITSVQIVLNRLDADIARFRTRVFVTRSRVERLEARMTRLQELATEQAVELYKTGSVDTLEALLDVSSIGELGSRIDLLGVAAEKNTDALVRYGRLRAAIRAHHRALFARERELDRARSAHAEVLARKTELKRELRRELAALTDAIGRERSHKHHLEKAARRLKERIVAAQAEHSVRILGTSRRGFVWPLNGPVTSPFGERWDTLHAGIDINGYTGQPIVAAKAGLVIFASSSMSGYGNTIVLDHGGGISTLYAHMSDYAVTEGVVDQAEIIGYLGCTGNCYGDHLHFEVRVDGNPVDPRGYLP
jgi:murein DD-endopeptidase MepM/ murein hydrolase activator NlpD